MHRFWLIIVLFTATWSSAQKDQVWLHPNHGQWDHRIQHKVELSGGEMYFEPAQFTYYFREIDFHHSEQEVTEDSHFPAHVIRTLFLNANPVSQLEERETSYFYRNYLLGADTNLWVSNVKSVRQVLRKSQYPNIDMLVETGDKKLEYSWIVAPGADLSQIAWRYEGSNKVVKNKNGSLTIYHSLGTIQESAPIAWLQKNGEKKKVAVSFSQKDGVWSFDFNGVKQFDDTLVIDPSLTFSSFTGSTVDNWGFTAAPDINGNLYGGGVVFGLGYPVTSGAFDLSFNGGPANTFQIDVGISKFNADGTNLLYSTYLGGSDNETPNSIIADQNGDLYILGVTGSPNFPLAGVPFDNSFNGGPTLSGNLVNNLQMTGADLFVARLNPTGTALIASTYLGGSGSDGINIGTLHYNYGDQFRGEIVVDQNNVYLSSVTNSTDFPIINGSQPLLGGGQDAVLVKLDKNLSSIAWSTYFGGSGDETGNGLQLSSTGTVYLAGGTTAGGLNFGLPGFDVVYDGNRDGFVAGFNGLTGLNLFGTYIGTTNYDQAYFVQLDNNDDVYVYGQSNGTIPISPGCYGNANSGQFVAKYSTNLASQSWITKIGAGTGQIEISPTAFLVSNCKDIYLSGWGGQINQSGQATQSSSNGFPVTPDAFQANTNGSNFWVAVLDQDATFLKYATYMGGTTTSFNHVDGGTSRFDKNGNIYHAVCGGCGGADFGFSTTPGAWSPNNPSPNCNMAVFKFELSTIEAVITDPDPLICLPDPVIFQNNSANGNQFFWNFGDGSTSTQVNPSHLYSGPGQYTVTLVVTDTNQCYTADSISFVVNIGAFQGGVVDPNIIVCPGEPAQLEAFGGINYLWSPAALLNNAAIPNPIASVTQNTLFTCIISDSCGTDTVQVQVNVTGGNVVVSSDTSICLGNFVPLEISGVVNASWSPATFLDNPNSLTPVSTPTNSITYQVTGFTIDGCELTENVTIQVFFDPPIPVMADTLSYCDGTSGIITVSGAETYSWSPAVNVSPTTGSTVTISAITEEYYYCDFTNACGTIRDSVWIDLVVPVITAGEDTIVCPGEVAFMQASGGLTYTWFPTVTGLTPNYDSVSVIAPISQFYTVYGQDQFGCIDSAKVFIDLFPQPFIQTNPDVYAVFGESVNLSATSTTPGPYVWSPAEYLSCVNCQNPVAQPDQNFVYTVTYTDVNGCSASDNVSIFYEPIIYVPNTFTPDGNEFNNTFFALGSNIDQFELMIFNRWGELIYKGGKLDEAWDGTYEGYPCQDGVYIWKIKYTDFLAKEYKLVGHVTLIR